MSEKKSLELRIRQQAVAWTEELSIQSDAIVSKILVEQKTGTVTVFAFDKGQALSEHSAPFDAFVHILSGQMTVTLNGQPVQVREGQSLIMPASVPHALHADESARMLLVMVRS